MYFVLINLPKLSQGKSRAAVIQMADVLKSSMPHAFM
jgi:hypothetical protein